MDADGLISWTIPCLVIPGAYPVGVKVSDECSDDIETFEIVVTCDEPEEVGLDSFRVAFEDIAWNGWNSGGCDGDNDFDYEDCVSDVDVDGWFICNDDYLKEIKFTITYLNDGSGYIHHKFGLKMPSIFVGKSCTYDLNSLGPVAGTCPVEFIFFDEDLKEPGDGPFDLIITFDSPFAYTYNAFEVADIHGDNIDIKPFIDALNTNTTSTERIAAGTGDKRVLLVPDGWAWPSPDATPIWDVYNEVNLVDCYPVFDDSITGWTP